MDEGLDFFGLEIDGSGLNGAINDTESGAATKRDGDEVAGTEGKVGMVGEKGAAGAKNGRGNYLEKHRVII